MRIVLDTNVLVSALLTAGGTSSRAVQLCRVGFTELLVDERILAEYREVLSRTEFSFAPDDVADLMTFLERAEHLTALPLPFTLPDPDDQPFLEVAVTGGADAIVTGNAKHFKLREGRLDVAIWTPARFLEAVAGTR